jgi:FkbM family methyltransferase
MHPTTNFFLIWSSMNEYFGQYINKVANKIGLEIHRYLPQKRAGSLRSMADVCAQAKKCGMKINTVFDVGVANGTPGLYGSFPDALFILVEPLYEFKEVIETISKKYSTIFIQAAASDEVGMMKISINQDNLDGTSLFKYRTAINSRKNEREIELTTLDKIATVQKTSGPYLIKADVQGAELKVINGAQTLLNQTEMIILETSMYEFMKGAPQFVDIITAMKAFGFVVYDFIDGSIRPLDGALGQIDVAFVKENGVLRQSHLYA